MKIRKMVIEDYEKVYQLWMSCAGMGLNNLDDSKEGTFFISQMCMYNKCFANILFLKKY